MRDFDAIYQQSVQKVYRFLLRLTGDDDLAMELTQETFYQAYLHIDQFKDNCAIDTWLCQIARNAYYKELRRRKRYAPEEQLEHMSAPDLFQNVDDREQALALHRQLHRLSEPYREVFSLHIFGELTFREIAGIFEKSESWAKMTYYRAKAALIRGLEEQDESDQ